MEVRTFRNDRGYEIRYHSVDWDDFVWASGSSFMGFRHPEVYNPPKTAFSLSYTRCSWCGVKNTEIEPYCIGCGGPL